MERAQGATSGGTRSTAAGPATTSRTSRWTRPRRTARRRAPAAPRRWPATTRSSCRPTARAGCSRRPGWSTGRCRRTTSRTSRPSRNPLYGQQANPTRQVFRAHRTTGSTRARARAGRRGLPVRLHDVPADRAPHGRRDEPLAAVPVRAAAGDVLRGLPRARRASGACEHGGWATIVSAARPRSRRGCWSPTGCGRCGSRAGSIHQVGLPYHWGSAAGLVTGDSANDLFGITLDPNVHIQETKVATCDIRPGRRPHGPRPAPPGRRLPARAGITVDTGNAQRTPPRQPAPATPKESIDEHPVVRFERPGPRRRVAGPARRARASSPTPRSASAARRARWRARSGTRVPEDGLSTARARSYDNTGALGASTWRHVAFIEQTKPLGAQRSGVGRPPVDLGMPSFSPPRGRGRRGHRGRHDHGRRAAGVPLADVLRRVQALHARRLPGRVPDRLAVPHRVRHGRRAGRHLQRLRLLRARPARTA